MESGAFVRECLLGGCMKTPFPIFGCSTYVIVYLHALIICMLLTGQTSDVQSTYIWVTLFIQLYLECLEDQSNERKRSAGRTRYVQ